MRVGPIVAGVAALAALVAGVTVVPTGGTPEASAASGVAPRSAADGILGSFSALGSGVNDSVQALMLQDDTLYVGGEFTSPGRRIVTWAGPSGGAQAWAEVGAGLNGNVDSIVSIGGALYAGGSFDDTAGGAGRSGCGFGRALSCVASWNGTAWNPVGGGLNHFVTSIVGGANGTVYASGGFDDTGATLNQTPLCRSGPIRCVAQWDGTRWYPLSSGLDGVVSELITFGGTLVAVGQFTAKVATWNGAGWTAVGGNSTDPVNTAAVLDGKLYVGGGFSTIGGASVPASGVARWNGTTWSSLGTGLNGNVRALASDDTRGLLYAAGNFTQAGSSSASRVAVWDEKLATWIPVSWGSAQGQNGLNEYVDAILVDGESFFVGGVFTGPAGEAWNGCTLGGTLNCVAKWTWDPPQGANALVASAGSQITITGEGFIGVPTTGGVQIGGTPVTYTRTSTTSITATAPAGVLTNAAITVDGVGGVGNVGTFSTYVPPPPPVYPPSAPTDATATAGDARATVTWSAPSSSGSFPVTSYQVESIPAGGSCLSSTLTCDATGLTNGTSYTFRIRALNGAGWSDWSSPSNAVTPEAPPPPPTPSIVITGSRGEGNDARTVYVDGTAMHLASPQVQAWVRLAGQPSYRQGITVPVGSDSRFTWKRATGKKTYVYFVSGDVRSNRVIIPAA